VSSARREASEDSAGNDHVRDDRFSSGVVRRRGLTADVRTRRRCIGRSAPKFTGDGVISAAARRLCSFLQPAREHEDGGEKSQKEAWQTTLRAPQDAARIRFGLEEAMPPGTAG